MSHPLKIDFTVPCPVRVVVPAGAHSIETCTFLRNTKTILMRLASSSNFILGFVSGARFRASEREGRLGSADAPGSEFSEGWNGGRGELS